MEFSPAARTPNPGSGLSSHKDINEIANQVVSGAPVKCVLRGIEKGDGMIPSYSSDVSVWPRSTDGKIMPQVCWGGLMQPLHQANLHFLIAGVPGTGKTLAIQALMRSVFGQGMRPHLAGKDRAVIYDPKQEFYPRLRGFGCPESQVAILNPFDRRGQPWDLAVDYNSPSDAHQLARTIIPTLDNHQQPFFPKAAAALLAAVVSVHMRLNPWQWDLADVLVGCFSHESLVKVMCADPRNPLVALAANFLAEPTTRNNVLAELASHVVDFLPVAACWRRARQEGATPVSIRAFLQSPDQIVLLGANQTHRVALTAINRLFLRRLAEETLDHVADGQWSSENRTWLFLDEVRELGKVEGLGDLINKGRSRGICAVLGFQDYPGLKHAFGDLVAHELTATSAHKLFLKLGAESAEWASRCIGKSEIRETNFSRSAGLSASVNTSETSGVNWSPGIFGPRIGGSFSETTGVGMTFNHSVTASSAVRETDAILPSEVAHLPGFAEGGGLTAFACLTGIGGAPARVHRVFIPAPFFFDEGSSGLALPGFEPRPPEDGDLFQVLKYPADGPAA